MPEAKNPEDGRTRHEVDISRSAVPGGWAWIVMLMLLSAVLYITFLTPPQPNQPPRSVAWWTMPFVVLASAAFSFYAWIVDRSYRRWLCLAGLVLIVGLYILMLSTPAQPDQPPRPVDWWNIPYVVLAFAAILFFAWLFHWAYWRWLHLAQRPRQELERGDVAAAERAYEKALAYARKYPPDDHCRGTMLLELANYLTHAGRRVEARAVLDESVAILEKHASRNGLDYFIVLNNLAVYLTAGKDFQAAQQTLERALDLSPTIKKSNIQSPELDLVLRFNLVSLFIKMNCLEDAKLHLNEAEKQFGALSWRSRKAFGNFVLVQRCLCNCALGQYEAVEKDTARVADPKDPDLIWAQAKVDLARREFAQAERILRRTITLCEKAGTAHRPETLEMILDLAEAFFGQGKHDQAFASLVEAQNIVADFALPPDAAWRKTLETWLQRARELGKSDEVALLEAELQKIPVTANQAITILEKFRIHPQAVG